MQLSINKPDRLSLFTLLWAIANIYHSIAYPGALMKPLAFLTFLFAVLLVFRPKSITLFILLLFFSICKTFRTIPFTSNHLLLDFAINIGILATLVAALLPALRKTNYKSAINKLDREKLFDSFAPMARVGLLILYFFAVLHKLNWDYFNPVVSCSTWYLDAFRGYGITIIPDNMLFKEVSVYGSILVEAGIPLLLLFKRTRLWGILLGLGFHLFLSLEPHEGMFSFVVMLYSLFMLFTPADFPEKLYLVIKGILEKNSMYLKFFLPLGFISILTILLILSTVIYPHPIKYIPFAAWYLWAMCIIIIFLTVIMTHGFNNDGYNGFFKMRKGLLVIPVLLFLNGFSPYLGLKTQLSFSMFSNLRTEGGTTNHFFIPATFHFTGWQQDLVEVKATDVEKLSDYTHNNRLVTFFEFKRIVSAIPEKQDYYVSYIRNNKNYELVSEKGKSNLPDVTTPHPWLLAKFVRFRSVDQGPCLCKH